MKALDTIKDLPIFFDRSFAIDKLIAKANYYVETKGVRLVVFDYLTLIHGNNKVNRDSEVGRITEALKEFAVRTNTAVLGAAQFNRDPGKEVRRPKPEDLRDSGVIEQVVDTLLFPWDPAVKENQKNPELVTDGLWLDLYCAKQRDGESGWSIPLYYDKNLQTFESQTMRGEIAPRNKPVVPTAQPVKSFHEKDDEDRGPF
jgi:replicative DNA helicase